MMVENIKFFIDFGIHSYTTYQICHHIWSLFPHTEHSVIDIKFMTLCCHLEQSVKSYEQAGSTTAMATIVTITI